MSSSRNTKRKRSKAGAPATSSNRERAVAPEPAHPASATTSISAAEATSNNKTADAAASTSTSITKPSSVTGNTNESASNAFNDSPAEGKVLESQSADQSSEKGGMKNEANATEPISKSSVNGKSTETDKMADTNSSNDKIQNSTPASALESIDASSSSTSSQDGTSTRRQALHIANDDDDREKRMRDLISHRSILLERVRACRASAENRIGEKSDGNNNKINANDLSDNQEIAAFRSMTKQANQAARKVKEGEGVGEKRTSLTLRRGSSVGKRMNAALSSLVPGSHVTVTTGGGANNPSAGHTTTTTAGKPLTTNNSHSAESKSEVKGSSPTSTKYTATKSSGRLPINHLSNDSFSSTTIQTPSTSTKSNANSKSNKTHSPFPSQLTKQHDASTRGRPPNSKNTKIMKTGGTQIATAAQNPLSSAQNLKKNAALPMGVRSASMMTSSASSHLLAGKKLPKVNFPEAIALREKREQIEIQLRNLMERRHLNASMTSAMMAGSSKITASSTLEDESSRRKGTPGSVVSAKPTSNKKMLHPAINKISNIDNGLEISSPASLPNRRRTHWDIVLQEMTWLASDFMEERKWKLSTSRLVSSNIPTHGLSDRRKRSPEASRGGSDSTPRELPSDQNNNIPGDCSSSDAPEDHGRGARVLKKKDARRKYWVPATDDDEMVKCRSQILSCMISELEVAIKKGGSLENSDKHHEQALKRFVAQRSHIIRSMKNCNDPIFSKDSNVGDTIKDSKSVRKSDEVSEDASSQNESSFENIDDYIEHFHRVCKSKHKLPAKETAKALKSGKIKLTSKQKEMLEFVDKLWSGKPHSGAVVVGSSTSGMTFGTATVIWKQRTQGSQVLICPSRSLIRWKYELNRFSNIRVLTFGSSGGISNPDGGNNVAEIQSTDVILCEYGSVSRMKNALKRMSVNPFSVIVDLRHFVGLRKSLRASTSTDSKDFPLELLSNNWWGEIVALVRSREIRCLLLEYYDSDPLSLSNCGLGQKEQISILAKRAACVIGPEVFDSRSHSIEREVIAWARKKGKNDILDKALRVRKILQDAIDPMCLRAAKPIVSSFDFAWELRSCEMSAAQRQEYERCCYEVRGALSSTFEVPNSNRCHFSVPVVANALFRLRQECFYSRKHAMQSNIALYGESRAMNHKQHKDKAISSTKNKSSDIWVNSSQPDADKAYSILKSSSKLKELVSILTSEGGYNLNFDESTKKMFGIMKGAKKGKDAKGDVKKIVIFAALPNFQQVVSTLLNSLGIQNELLCRYEAYVNDENGAEGNSPSLDNFTEKYEAIAWAKSQSVLSRFCSDDHTRKANIVIASPAALSGRNDGIGIEGADMLITLDSDWSGRDGFVVNSLVRRWQAKNKLCGKEDKLIRLVSADSIEEQIFDDNDRDNGVLSWPLDTDGFFTLPTSEHEATVLYKKVTENIDPLSCCAFPAMAVLQNRGYLLKVVLASNRYLPSLFGSGKPAIFLPRHLNKASTDQETIAELHFLKYFLRDERNSSVSTQSITLSKEPKVCQISSAGFISRKDMPMIGSRLCLEKLINSHSLSNDFEDHPSMNSLCPDVLLNVAQAEGESSIPKIDENPSSLLFYEPYQESLSNSEGSLIKSAENKTKRRYNAYAKLFSNSWNGISLRDGNQGCEPLVFFPPLFPLIDEVSKKARMHYDSSAAGTTDTRGKVILTGNNDNSGSQKRKDRDFAMTYNDIDNSSKRPKIKSETGHKINGHAGLAPSQGISNSKDHPVAQNGKAQVCSPTSTKGSKVNKPCSPKLIMTGEDFGLLGSGAFPTPMDAISFSAHDAKVNRSYLSSWNKPDYGSHLLPCDPEETSSSASKHLDEGMQSVLLFVKKRPRSTQTAYRNGQGLHSIVPLPIGSKVVGDESAKKIKKRSQGNSQLPPTAFTRLPGNLGTQHSQILSRSSPARQVKGDFRHKLLASFYSRQRATGLTLFDSIPYRVASMRVEKRVMARLEKLMWKSTLTLDAGPGLPIQLVEKSYSVDRSQTDSSLGWSSIIDQLKDGSSPGDIAKAQSRVQKHNFKRSSVSPHCVDFGAFEVGYLASPSGMTGIPRTRIRVGVSLPMGVKVMRPTKDQERSSAWNMRDDKILQETVKKFGMNWLLVASATSGFEHAVINGKLPAIDDIAPSVAKSARQCRDRWQLLAQSQPSLANELRRSEILFRETALSTCDALENITVANQKGTSSIFSAENINILCKSDDFLHLSLNKESTSDTDSRCVDSKESVKQSEVASPRSTVDKKDDDTANNHNSSHYVTENTNDPSSVTEDVEMSDAFKVTKPKRRSFKSILGARSRRQIFPVTIPGVDVGGNQAGHPVPSHPSHMQSVQISVAAQWASGRTEMWPLQILDLADKQRSGAARINNMQRGEIPTVHNPSRRHPTGSSSYQHRPQPSQSSAVRAPVGYSPGINTTARPVAPRPVNASVTPRHQHRAPQVAASTVQAYIPPQTTASGKPKKNDKQKPTSKTSPKKG